MGFLPSAREAVFVRKSFYRFLIPSLFSCLGIAAGALADCVFVGNAIGPVGMTAISIGQPVYMLFNTISYSLSIGGSIRYANALGEGKVEEGNRIFANVLFTDLLLNIALCNLGLLFLPQVLAFLGAGTPGTEVWANCEALVRTQLALVPIMFCQGPFYYFVNCDNDPKLAALAFVTSNTLDIVFNYVFVVLLDMGIAGSVYSTGVGAAVMILISLVHFIKKRGCLRFRWPGRPFSTVLLSFRTGFATSVQYVYQFLTILVCNRLLMSISGELAVAVFGIVFNVSLLAASVHDAISMALHPMVSTFHGEHNSANIRCTLRQAFQVSLAADLLLAALLLGFPRWVSLLFGLRTAEAFAMGSRAIRVYALCLLPSGINMVLTFYYQALGREFASYLLFTLRSFVCFLAFSLLFSRGGVEMFWWAYPCMELASLAVMALYNGSKGSWTYLHEDDSRVFRAFLDSRSADLGATGAAVSAYLEGIGASAAQNYFASVAVEEVCGVILSQAFSARDGYIQFTIVPGEDGTVTLHLRDNAEAFNPFDMNTDEISLEDGTGLDAIGVKVIKSKAKSFFYRRYAGFNTLVVQI
ncbi:MAG: MATE family efflux transporter [Candidatus Ventricola sp.]